MQVKFVIGKTPNFQGKYAKEMYFKILNLDKKTQILNLLNNTDWESLCNGSSGQYNLTQNKIYKYIKEQILEIE